MKRQVEIRSYNLKPGSRDEFHRLVRERSIPMLHRWGVDVVAFGPSQHDETSYYLIRAYDSLDHRQASQAAFYGGAEWREGPRDEIVPWIESYTSIVIEMETGLVEGLRTQQGAPARAKPA